MAVNYSCIQTQRKEPGFNLIYPSMLHKFMQIPEPTIFIVDDNKPICDALFWLLHSNAGLPVTIYHDAQTFLRDYRSNWYGCLLVDVLMPNMNGFELLEELKARDNQMP